MIPNYNGEQILEKNLQKVLEVVSSSKLNNSEIIISDDKSTDNSVDIINKFIDKNKKNEVKIKLLTANLNKGFSSNANRGANAASGDILVLLNTDVFPSRNFLEHLLPHFKDETIFAVGCMDESVEEKDIILRGRGKGKWEKGFLVHSAADVNSGSETLWVSGGSGAFRKSVWDKLGGFDRLYDPFYWEDIDLSYRALKSGYKIVFEKKSIVRHEHEKGVIKSKFKPYRVKKIVYRNQFIFAWKNSDNDQLLRSILWTPYHLFNSLVSRDFAMILGFFTALKRLSGILESRRKVRKYFILSDSRVASISK